MEDSTSNSLHKSLSDEINESEQQSSQNAAIVLDLSCKNKEPENKLQQTTNSNEATGEGSKVQKEIVLKKKPVTFKTRPYAFLRRSQSHLTRDKGKGKTTSQKCEKTENVAKEETNVETQVNSLTRDARPSTSRAHDLQEASPSVPIVTNLQPQRAPADSSSSRRTPIGEFRHTEEEGLYIRTFRIPIHRKTATEEITLPNREVMNTLEFDHHASTSYILQDLESITPEKVEMALRQAKDEYKKDLLNIVLTQLAERRRDEASGGPSQDQNKKENNGEGR